MKSILEIYKDGAQQFQESHDSMVREHASPKALAACAAEIKHYTDHARRLETNHAECVVSCCMGCTLGGLPKETNNG